MVLYVHSDKPASAAIAKKNVRNMSLKRPLIFLPASNTTPQKIANDDTKCVRPLDFKGHEGFHPYKMHLELWI